MPNEIIRDPATLAQIVKGSLQTAQEQTAGLRKMNTRLVVASIISSAITTLVAGGTAAAGPVVGQGDDGWRIACIVAALLSFTSTVCAALIQQLGFSERLLQGNQCVGRLRSLDIAIATGGGNWDEITKEYGEIVKTYPEIIGG